ncbi:MAG: hypothetical protein ACM3MD_02345, partial [Betaproteobacteria bacterium]
MIDDESRTTSRSGKRESLDPFMVCKTLYLFCRQLQGLFENRKNYFRSIELTPSVWTNVVEYWTGSIAPEGRKGSCHEKAEVVQFR